MTNMVSLQLKITRTKNTKIICTNYGRNEHTIDTCYRNQGFPPRYKFHNSKNDVINNIDDINETGNDLNQQSALGTQDVRLSPQQYQGLMYVIQ